MARNNNNIKGYIFPMCKQQRDFEDLARELVKVLSELDEQQQIDIFEYAQQIYSNRNNKYAMMGKRG